MVEVNQEEAKQKMLAIHMDPKVVDATLKNKKVTARLLEVIDQAKIENIDKAQGVLLYNLSTKLPPSCLNRTQICLDFIAQKKWLKLKQMDEAFKWLKENNADIEVDLEKLAEISGVGIEVTPEEVDRTVRAIFEDLKEEIMEKKHQYQFNNVIYEAQKRMPWGENKEIIQKINAVKLETIGEAPKVEGRQKKNKQEKKPEPKKEEKKEEEKKAEEEEDEGLIASLDKIGRDLASTRNTPEILAKHKEFTQGRIVTRFPPEPNGYLHIGHAKSMRLNFLGAKQVKGICYLRYDDTNPCKENHEFIEHIEKNVKWMGHQYWKMTHASDYFQELRDLAVELIKRGKAYVCHQTKAEMNEGREKHQDSPYRNRSVEENLKLFKYMEMGCYAEGEACLRMKIDMQHVNPNMWDPVAYRIKYVPHPMTGDKWCIYPTYDYTHCLCDSLENITHSCCTLEFESRRESYFWLLEALDLYRPQVKEFSRLNITYTVLSKRRLEWLVNSNTVRGWDDPRLLTLEGLKRRGYTPEIINNFCHEIGISRKGNENQTSIKLLEHHARTVLDKSAQRIFAVLSPLLLEITNIDEFEGDREREAPFFPTRPEEGKQKYEFTRFVYIDRDDFSKEHKKGFFGLTPEQNCMLRYASVIKLEEVVEGSNGEIELVKVKLVKTEEKPKGVIQWVSKDHAIDAEVRLMNLLFTVEEPMSFKDKWMNNINPDSMIVKQGAKLWARVNEVPVGHHYQFERIGYFVKDKDSEQEGRPVFNRVVELRESNLKKQA